MPAVSMTRVQISGALLAMLLAASVVIWTATASPEAPYLRAHPAAAWITPPVPVFPSTHVVIPHSEPAATFRRAFTLAGPQGEGWLRVRALGSLDVEVNGEPVPLPAGDRDCLKRECTATLTNLRAGQNDLRAKVRNGTGPPALWLSLESPGSRLATDEEWGVAVADAPESSAAIADDTRTFDDAATVATPLEALRARSGVVGALFVGSALLFLVGRRSARPALLRHAPEIALGVATLFWVGLYFSKFAEIPIESGFDGRFHVQYVRHVAEHGRLPLATGGPAMYQPPLFYASAAGLHALFDPDPDAAGERWLLRLLPFLSGLGMVWIAWALVRRLAPDDAAAAIFAVALTAFVPVNLYMAAYVSNEPVHAALASVGLLVLCTAILSGRVTRPTLGALAFLLALCAMTKYTALGIAAVFAFFLAFSLCLAERTSVGRAASAALVVLGGATLLAGWVYVRNWIHHGDPLIWNVDLPGGGTWWQPPGFRTAGYYLGFGESLRHPFFSGFHSFWDGLYATFWGEGLPPTAYRLAERHGVWDYDWMSAGYLLALPGTAVLGVGSIRTLRDALVGDDLRRRSVLTLLLSLIALVALGLLQISIRWPVWGAVRASYLLVVLVPLAMVGALGFSSIDRWLERLGGAPLRAILYGWLGAMTGVFALSFAA
jgi:hypothetical protein